jgi:hypothetical protein
MVASMLGLVACQAVYCPSVRILCYGGPVGPHVPKSGNMSQWRVGTLPTVSRVDTALHTSARRPATLTPSTRITQATRIGRVCDACGGRHDVWNGWQLHMDFVLQR